MAYILNYTLLWQHFKVLGKLKNIKQCMKNKKSYALDSWLIKTKGPWYLGNKLPNNMFVCVVEEWVLHTHLTRFLKNLKH